MIKHGKFLKTQDNHKIAYAHYDEGHKKAVIIAPGFFNSKDAILLKKLKDHLIDTYDVVMFDFRGHGESSGLFTWTAKESLDLERVIDYAKTRYSKIGLIGFSFGAAISIQVVAKDKSIASFISISAPQDPAKVDYHFLDLDIENDIIYNLREGRIGKGVRPGPFWHAKKKPIDLVDKIMCPILYIHGDNDWVIRHAHSQKLYEKTKSKKKIAIIKDGPHAEYLLRKNTGETIPLIQEWFKETL
ncbi:MAG: alpha/beta fold hydrolase [Candidatus Omnitrophica bacterium]|nr:alpha/beta fold hydrolase [Candidatus Omnitrophota bacterium]